jgi:succinyl-diaminopimelate desuccinylase
MAFARAIAFAAELIRIPSPPGAERGVAERVRTELETLGFADVRIDRAGNVIGVARGTGGGPTVMLSSHLDVVDAGDATTWEHPPYGGVVADGFLHGRGAMDIKGPLAVQTYAAAAFLERPLAGDVVVAHTVLEERGGWGMEWLLEEGDVRPDAVIIGESTHGDVCIGHRGRAELFVDIEGVAGHASAPDRAHNPMRLLPAVLPALDAFAAAQPADPVLGRATLAPTAIETSPRSRNVIPDRVRVVLDWRVLPGRDADALRDLLAAHLQRSVRVEPPFKLTVRYATERQRTWTGQERERRLHTPGFLLPPGHAVARAAAEAVAAGTGRAPALRAWTFATDGGHTCGERGIPTIGFAPGEERFAHTNRERLDLAEAERALAVYPAVIRAVARAARGG